MVASLAELDVSLGQIMLVTIPATLVGVSAGILSVAWRGTELAEDPVYRQRLAEDPLGRENYQFAQQEKFLLREDRTFLKLASTLHANT